MPFRICGAEPRKSPPRTAADGVGPSQRSMTCRVDGSEVGLEADVAAAVLERRDCPAPGRGSAPCRRCRRARAPPIAIITPAAPWSVPWLPFSLMRRPNSENCSTSVSFEQPLVAQVGVERRQRRRRACPSGWRTRRSPAFVPCPACVSKPPVCTQNTRVPMPRDHRAGDRAQRQREAVVRIRHASAA